MLHRSVLLSFLIAGGCTVGEAPGQGGDDDSGGPPDADPLLPDADPNCEAAKTPISGHHEMGNSCMQANCHAPPLGLNAPLYTIAGTLYTDAAGAAGVEGATIVITDSATPPVTVELTTGSLAITAGAGNFFTTQPLTPPFTVKASRCPTTMLMADPAPEGNCNSCHRPGGTANARIHL